MKVQFRGLDNTAGAAMPRDMITCVPVNRLWDCIAVAEFVGKWSTHSRVATIIMATSGNPMYRN